MVEVLSAVRDAIAFGLSVAYSTGVRLLENGSFLLVFVVVMVVLMVVRAEVGDTPQNWVRSADPVSAYSESPTQGRRYGGSLRIEHGTRRREPVGWAA